MNSSSTLFAGSLQLLGVLAAEVTLIIVAAALLARWTKSAAWRRSLWQASLVAVLVLTACELSGSARSLAGWAGFLFAQLDPGRSVAVEEPGARVTGEFRSRVEARLTARERTVSASEAARRATRRETPVSPSDSKLIVQTTQLPPVAHSGSELWSDSIHVLWLWLLWATGTTLVAARAWLGRCLLVVFRLRRRPLTDPVLLGRVRRLARALDIRRQVRVVESPRLSGPIAFGLIRPAIGLPQDFCARFRPDQQEVMLAHEIAHLAGHDPAWSLLADFSAALLWWHPAVWWTRRQFYLASEQTADEASLMLKDGPAVLAECLLELGARLAANRGLGQLQVSGFRSHLGRRVQRLLHLEAHRWSRPARLRAGLLLTLGPLATAALVVLCTAWATPQALTKGNTMSSMQLTWKRSMATLALLVAFHSPDPTAAAAEPDNSAAETAPGDAPPAAVNAPAPRASPADAAVQRPNKAREDAAREAFLRRYGLARPAGGGSNVLAPNTKREKIENKLNEIILPEIAFDGVPLTEVLKVLSDQSIKLDPEKKGINFLVNNNSAPSIIATSVDPATGLPIAAATEQINVGDVTVKFSLPLRNVSLKDTLEAVVKVADLPVEYSVEDYGVVISPKAQANPVKAFPALTGPIAEVLVACTFKVDTNTFLAGLENAFGISVPAAAKEKTGSHAREIQSALKTLLTQLGVSSANAQTVFYNDLTGIVMVRAKQGEEGVIQAAIETLGGTPVSSYPTSGGGGFGLATPGHR